jgi:hypothetical protein
MSGFSPGFLRHVLDNTLCSFDSTCMLLIHIFTFPNRKSFMDPKKILEVVRSAEQVGLGMCLVTTH